MEEGILQIRRRLQTRIYLVVHEVVLDLVVRRPPYRHRPPLILLRKVPDTVGVLVGYSPQGHGWGPQTHGCRVNGHEYVEARNASV